MYFCLSCLTGKESQAVENVQKYLEENIAEDFSVWFPQKINRDKKKGVYTEHKFPLFPGYLFIYWGGEDEINFPFHEIRKIPQIVKILKYENNSHALLGSDYNFAHWIHENDGEIKPSRVFCKEGSRLRIISGPLVGMDANVIKVDKHHKRITLRFTVGDKTSDISFSVDFINTSTSVL
ncbi:MAG: hypothetical protein K5634_02640 [Sphaerochaetaceae bacterium]|nr:hypothetical protein [Sphaerochaetaceae bacterium]